MRFPLARCCAVRASLLAVCFLTPLCSCLATNVVSRPAGFLHVRLAPREQKFVSVPFQAWSSSIQAVLTNQLTGSTNELTADRVLKWDTIVPAYLQAVKTADGLWVEDFATRRPSAMTVDPGEGLILNNRQSVSQEVFFCGEVLLEDQAELDFYPGPNLFGYPHLAHLPLSTGMVQAADAIRSEDGSSPTNLSFGVGFWYWRGALDAFTWGFPVPYANIFPRNEGPPRVLNMNPGDDGRSMTLLIQAAGLPGEKLDVYRQDILPGGRFDPEFAWQVAALDLVPGHTNLIAWTDAFEPGQVHARTYLVGESQIDSDQDGVPDCRERFILHTDPSVPEETDDGAIATNQTNWLPLPVTNLLQDGTLVTNGFVRVPAGGARTLRPRVIYVDRRIGQDALNGRLPIVVGIDGPKKTIAAGLSETRAGDRLVVKEGSYGEDLDIRGRAVSVQIVGQVDLTGPRKIPPPSAVPGECVLTNGWSRP